MKKGRSIRRQLLYPNGKDSIFYRLNPLRGFFHKKRYQDHSGLIEMNRKSEKQVLSQYFNSPPSGPSVIVGAEGSGRTELLREVKSKKKEQIFW
jgi:hypothetical protein